QTTRDGPDRSRLATSVQPRELTTKHVHAKRPTCVAIIPPPPTDPPTPPTMAVTSDDDGRLMRWAIGGGKAVSNFTSSTRHQGKAAYVAALGNLALTAGYDATVLLHNLATGHTRTKDIFKKSKPEVGSVGMWEGGAVLSGTNDGRLLLWNTVDLRSTNDVLYQAD